MDRNLDHILLTIIINRMTELELNALEEQIDKLIESHHHLKLENRSLQKKINSLNDENIALLEQKKQAAQSVKSLILRLQDELKCQQ